MDVTNYSLTQQIDSILSNSVDCKTVENEISKITRSLIAKALLSKIIQEQFSIASFQHFWSSCV